MIANTARQLGCERVTVGGVADHVHVVLDLPATVAVANLVQKMQGFSSLFINESDPRDVPFRWQGSYGAFTVDCNRLHSVRRYVLDQARHHAANDTDDALEQTFDSPREPKPRDGGAHQT
jgi:REP element-mobilizing transposase RayT